MIAARPEGLAVDFSGEPGGCVSGWDGPVRCEPFMAFAPASTVTIDDQSDAGSWARALAERPDPLWGDRVTGDDEIAAALAVQARLHALGILMLAAAKCAEVKALADSGRIDRDGAGLFIRRYSESICEIVAELAPVLRKGSN